MESLINKDLKNAIHSAQVLQGTSREGNAYYYLDLKFINGYSKRIFVNNEVAFALKDALRSTKSTDTVKTDFWGDEPFDD